MTEKDCVLRADVLWLIYSGQIMTGDNAKESAQTLVKEIPAADVQPVVFCRDCKCYQQSHFIDNHMECSRSGFPVHSVDFCSFGEKREES